MPQIKAQVIRPDGTIKPSLVVIENGYIQAVATIPRHDCETDLLLCPGFIDLQVNGAGGVLFNQDPTIDSLTAIGSALAPSGTTGWLATLVTDEIEQMQKAAEAVSASLSASETGVLGIHFEGPHLSLEKRGVHQPDHLRPLSDQELAIYGRDDLGVKLVTVAPETVSLAQIKQLIELDCIVSIGHTNASYEQVLAALDAGATCFTHLYNAMSGMRGREPGAVGAALDSDCYYGLIMDGIHVHPAMASLAYRNNPNMILVTDAMPPVGTDQDSFDWYGQTIRRLDDRLVDSEGRLAGACLTQSQAMSNAMLNLGLSIEDVLPMVTTYPADLTGLNKTHGYVESGAVADLVLMDETAEVAKIWRAGIEVDINKTEQ